MVLNAFALAGRTNCARSGSPQVRYDVQAHQSQRSGLNRDLSRRVIAVHPLLAGKMRGGRWFDALFAQTFLDANRDLFTLDQEASVGRLRLFLSSSDAPVCFFSSSTGRPASFTARELEGPPNSQPRADAARSTLSASRKRPLQRTHRSHPMRRSALFFRRARK